MSARVCPCGRRLVSQKIPAAQRPAGTYQHAGRGLCARCYLAASKRDELLDHERVTYSRDELLDEWEAVRGEVSFYAFAERMGMKHATWDQAFRRAAKVGDPRAVRSYRRSA
jgi:hypothetical protein